MHPHACEYLVVLDLETTAGDGVGGAGEVVEWPYAVVHLPTAAVVESRLLLVAPQWEGGAVRAAAGSVAGAAGGDVATSSGGSGGSRGGAEPHGGDNGGSDGDASGRAAGAGGGGGSSSGDGSGGGAGGSASRPTRGAAVARPGGGSADGGSGSGGAPPADAPPPSGHGSGSSEASCPSPRRSPSRSPSPAPTPPGAPSAHILCQGLPLGPSLHVFLTHLSRLLPPPATFVLATDGPWDLSVVLPREALAKRLTLPAALTTFFDLRTEFCRALPHAGRPHNRATLLAALHLPPPPPVAPATAIAHVRSLASVVVRLLAAGHHFVSPMLPPSIFAPVVAAGVPAADIVRLRGLPWSATEADVLAFFSSVPASPGGVRFVRNAAGKATGEAFLQVPPGGMDRALRRHRHMMGPRYVEVFASSPADMAAHLARCDGRGAREGRRADAEEGGGGAGSASVRSGGGGGGGGSGGGGGGGSSAGGGSGSSNGVGAAGTAAGSRPAANGARAGRHRPTPGGPPPVGLPRTPPAVSLLLRRLPAGTDAPMVRRLLTGGVGGVAASALGSIRIMAGAAGAVGSVAGGPPGGGGGGPATAIVDVYGEAAALASAKARSLQLDVVVMPMDPRGGGGGGGRPDAAIESVATGVSALSMGWGPPGGGSGGVEGGNGYAVHPGHGGYGGGGGHAGGRLPPPLYARAPQGVSSNRLPPPPHV